MADRQQEMTENRKDKPRELLSNLSLTENDRLALRSKREKKMDLYRKFLLHPLELAAGSTGMGRIASVLGAALLLVATVLTSIARAQATPAPSQSTALGPILSSKQGFDLLLLWGPLFLTLVLAWFIPYMLDICLAYRSRTTFWRDVINRLVPQGATMTADQLKELKGILQESPVGTRGLTRALVALTVLTGVGIALVLTLFSEASDAVDLRKTIIASLLSILATITGFYFGSRVSQEAAARGAPPSPPPGVGPQPEG